ncbi:HEAT repeat domain-containing protein [Klebsiella michiganensis]|uniref:HEAT repeat domain-containing protein n=1 Tax=Klebsiella michiganensis TaxID=1134687 RepID=UPI003D9AA0EE
MPAKNVSNSPVPTENIRSLSELKKNVANVLGVEKSRFFDIIPIMESLTRDDVIEILNDVLEKKDIASDYELLSEDHVYLDRQHNFNLLMRLVGNKPSVTLSANEFDIIIINPMSSPVSIPIYQSPLADGIYQQPSALIKLEDIILIPGKVYSFEAYKYILDFDAMAAQDAFVLIAHSEPKGWLSWVYDRNSLEPVESICTSLQASRIQMYVRLLGAMKATQAVPALEKLAKSTYANFVRWEAIESLSLIDPQHTLKLLEYLAENDTDVKISEAAAQSLAMNLTTRE